jgi:hypothetical protein
VPQRTNINFENKVMIKWRDEMGIKISIKEMERMIERLPASRKMEVTSQIKATGSIMLPELIKELIASGAESREILKEMQNIGFDEVTLSDSFALALCEINDEKNKN